MSHGKFALSLVAGLMGCFALALGLAFLLRGWLGPFWAQGIGSACAGVLGLVFGVRLKRALDARMAQQAPAPKP